MTGICHDNRPERPMLLPAAACDYTTGYLAAYGVLLALARRAREGGSYHVRVSLCQSGMFIHRQGKVEFDRPDMEIDASRARRDPHREPSQVRPDPAPRPAPEAFGDAAALDPADAATRRRQTGMA